MRNFYLDRKNRRLYLIAMLNILRNKYYVDMSRLSAGMEIYPTYIYDLLRGQRNPTHPTMDKIEIFLNDLYEPIVRDEIELNRIYFEKLSNNSSYEG